MRPLGVLSGALLGLGLAVLLQQYGVRVMTRSLLVQAVVSGALTGLVLPSLRFAWAVRRHNRRLDAAAAA